MGEPGYNPRHIGPEGGADAALSPEGTGSLPLRLSVGKTGLAIELSRPVPLAHLTATELTLGLEGLTYPLDLSRGVKQFLHRRTKATSLKLELNISALAKLLPSLSFAFPDGDVEFSVGASRAEGRTTGAVDTSFSFSLRGRHAALAWDLVLAAGPTLRFIVDRVRGLGLPTAPLPLVLQILDAIAGEVARALRQPILRRIGRSLVVEDLPKSVFLELMPAFAMRLPSVSTLRFERAEVAGNTFVVEFSHEPELSAVGRRGLRLAGLSELLKEGDDLFAQGELERARQRYVEALERIPGDRATLVALGELDSLHEDRLESALSFFDEAERGNGEAQGEIVQAAELLSRRGRTELAFERYLRIADTESEAAIAAYALLFAHELESKPETRLELLTRALERAPGLKALSLARFKENLGLGNLEGAAVDAERYVALAKSSKERASARAEMGNEYIARGHFERAVRVLSLAHRESPESLEVRAAFAASLAMRGDIERAVQLWAPLLRALHELSSESFQGRPREDVIREIHFSLAEAYAGPLSDPGLAVSELRAIETRGLLGARARELEGKMFLKLGDSEGRLRTHVRLLEAIELNWVELGEGMYPLLAAARTEAAHHHTEFALRACGLIEERVRGRHVSESERTAALGFLQLKSELARQG